MRSEQMTEALQLLCEDIRSTLSIHVNNRADVPRILKLVMLSIRERFPCPPSSARSDVTKTAEEESSPKTPKCGSF